MILSRFIDFIRCYWWQLTLFIMLLIAGGSLFPAAQLPSIPGTDKTHHFIGYGILMFPVALAKAKHFYIIALGLIGFGGLIELIQPYVNRYGEWLDFYANTGGLLCGYLLARLTNKWQGRK